MGRLLKRFGWLALLAAALPLRAQMGDTLSEGPQVALPVARAFTPSPPLTPADEQKTFQLAPGYRIELVAAEPLVHDPVAAAYDTAGNLWVVEFPQFNAGMLKDLPELARGVSAVPGSKIVELISTRHDGHYDRRVEWLTGLVRPRGIALVHDGVLIADPPRLILARDTAGAGRCDQQTVLLSNFAVPSSDEDTGSLLWGRDNVLHDISFVYDFLYAHGRITRLPVLMRGQFGISQDDWGRLFFSRNSDQLRSDLFAPRYNVRNPDATDFPWANVKIARDQTVWPSHPTPAINRGYRLGVLGESNGGLRPDGTLQEFTAACGSLVYRGAQFPPEVYGQVFVPEPAGNLIHLDLLREKNSRIVAYDADPHGEFLTSTDSRFRPVALANAPDGSMLVVDFYRGILEEYHILTSYLREQSLGRGLDRPMFGQGRLWRIVRDAAKVERVVPNALDVGPRTEVPIVQIPTGELVPWLTRENSFWREAAQQELVERGDRSAVPALADLAVHAPQPYTRVTALWTLDGLQGTTLDLLGAALHDAEPKVRQAAVRLHERFLGQSATSGRAGSAEAAALRSLEPMIADASSDVLIQLALTLGEDRSADVFPLMEQLYRRRGVEPWIVPALVTGLGGREFALIDRLESAGGEAGPILTPLASSVVHRADPKEVARLVALIAGAGPGTRPLPTDDRRALLAAFSDYFRPVFRRSMRPGAALVSAELAPLANPTAAPPALRAAAAQITGRLTQLEEAARKLAASAKPLTGAEERLYEGGRVAYQICAACHQANGGGLPNVAPSLVDSHWVTSHPEVLARIVLNGKEGTPGFPGAMPPIGAGLTNAQIAAVLTYVRNSWGLHAGAVSPAAVARVRHEVAGRPSAWTDKQLSIVESDLARMGR